jgi:hypothetical protein
MNYQVENVTEFAGVLTPLHCDGVVPVDYIGIDTDSAKKLGRTLLSHQIKRENQELFITKITIRKLGIELFKKGQSELVKRGNTYVLPAGNSWHPVRFKADFESVVRGADGRDYPCAVQIGNIEFDLRNATEEDNGDSITFFKVPAMIYSPGTYQIVLLPEE